jgi:hypothetical protein
VPTLRHMGLSDRLTQHFRFAALLRSLPHRQKDTGNPGNGKQFRQAVYRQPDSQSATQASTCKHVYSLVESRFITNKLACTSGHVSAEAIAALVSFIHSSTHRLWMLERSMQILHRCFHQHRHHQYTKCGQVTEKPRQMRIFPLLAKHRDSSR